MARFLLRVFSNDLRGLRMTQMFEKTDKHWIESPLDFKKVKSHLSKV